MYNYNVNATLTLPRIFFIIFTQVVNYLAFNETIAAQVTFFKRTGN